MKVILRFLLVTSATCMFSNNTQAVTPDQNWLFHNELTGQPDTTPPIALEKFIGEWVLKDHVFESSTNGKYVADVNPNRTFIARPGNTNTSILWEEDFDGLKVDIFWTCDIETSTVYHLSNTSNNGLAFGKGPLQKNGDLDIILHYPDACNTCSRTYSFRWIAANEFSFKATIFKDDISTGDYYGAIFQRKSDK